MASLLRVDEMQAQASGLMKFNSGAFNPTYEPPVSGSAPMGSRYIWIGDQYPVVSLADVPGAMFVEVAPYPPTVSGMYITVVFKQSAASWTMNTTNFDPDVSVPDSSGGDVHRVYYSKNNQWWDA